jgi:geranylgeranyl diphosphate synthase, type I
MLDYFKEQKPRINEALQAFLLSKEGHFRQVHPWGADLLQRLREFAGGGKMVRGGLVLLSHRMFRGQAERAALDAAVAMELIQAAFLIHDDIMDRDDLRRGKKTIHYQYQELGEEQALADPPGFGQAMGICAGDMVFFLAYDILNQLGPAPDMGRRLIAAVTREIYLVGLAQMQDIFLGCSRGDVAEDQVISVFRHKTARYTFSLPFALGAILAGQEEPQLEVLSRIGEDLGIIFQIKDDELGLFGDREAIGKPMGSDLRGAKKTLYYLYLLERASAADRVRLESIMGNPDLTADDILWVRERVHSLGIWEEVQKKMEQLAAHTRKLIASLKETGENKKVLLDILAFSIDRRS